MDIDKNKVSNLMNNMLFDISKKVLAIVGRPKDYLEIAAVLESLGYNDERIKKETGFDNVFEVSKVIFNLYTDKEIYKEINKIYCDKEIFEERYSIVKGIIDILRGFLSIGSLFISMFSIFVVNFSLWSFMDKTMSSVEQATAIAFATILGMIISGGFLQIFLRKGYPLLERRYYRGIWKVHLRCFKTGITSALIIMILLDILGLFMGFYRLENILVFDIYFISVTSIFLNLPVTNLMKLEGLFLVNLIGSMGVVWLGKENFRLNIIHAQLIAMLFFVIMYFLLLKIIFFFLQKTNKNYRTNVNYKPRLFINIYMLTPYFLYGLMYYILIFADRLIAWTSNFGFTFEPLIRMKGEYDLGMNWGILGILLPTLFIELYVKNFLNVVLKSKMDFKINEEDKFIRNNIKAFIIHIGMFFSINILGVGASVKIVDNIMRHYYIELSPYFSNISEMVFKFSIIGNLFLMVGSLNTIYLLYFSQWMLIIKSLSIAIVSNLVVGFILSRVFDYYFAVFGFLAGSIIFFVISFFYALQVFKNLNYYFYSNN